MSDSEGAQLERLGKASHWLGQLRLPAVDSTLVAPSFTYICRNSHIAGYVTITSTTRSRLWSDRREGGAREAQLARPFLSEICNSGATTRTFRCRDGLSAAAFGI